MAWLLVFHSQEVAPKLRDSYPCEALTCQQQQIRVGANRLISAVLLESSVFAELHNDRQY